MNFVRILILSFLVCLLPFSIASGAEEEFDSDKMMSELESQLKLSSEELSKLKPMIDAKSKELKESMHGAIDNGFVQLDELTKSLDAVSKDAQQKVEDFLNSEEMKKLKDYLSKIDEDAVREVKDKLIAELTAVLELTEEQVIKLKPILEDSLTQLSEILGELTKEGSRSWEEFKRQYELLGKELKEKLQGTLDKEQMKRLDKYHEEKKEKIKTTLFTV